jgi:hypothetical protein
MQKILDILNGKKTYLIATVAAFLAFANAMGWAIPEYVYVILGACGLATVRSAVSKV